MAEEQKKKKVEFNIIKNVDPMKGHKGFGLGSFEPG